MKESEKVGNIIDAKAIIAAVLGTLKMNAPAFSKATGIAYQRIYDLQRGRTKKFNPGVVNMITAAFPQVRKEFLYTGTGAVLSADIPADLMPNPLDIDLQPMLSKVMDLQNELLEKTDRLSKKERELHEREIELVRKEYELRMREAKLGMPTKEESRGVV